MKLNKFHLIAVATLLIAPGCGNQEQEETKEETKTEVTESQSQENKEDANKE